MVGCLLVAGCQTSTAGTAVPLSSSSVPVVVASGPRTFNLATLDPCAIIPQARRPAFGLDAPEIHSKSEGEPYCTLPSSVGPPAAVFFDFRKSAQDTVAPVQKYIKDTITINGFEIPLVSRPGVSQCEGFVQTGPSQYMSVALNGLGKVTDSELCKRVQPLLRIAIDTLEQLQPS